MPQIFSADHFFMVDGEYKFNPQQLPQAHGACLRDFIEACKPFYFSRREVTPGRVTILRGIPGCGKSTYISQHSVGDLVVDNTCTTVAEIAPYAAVGAAFGLEVEILTLEVAPEIGAARNKHNVPLESCKKMAARIKQETSRIPPYWNHRVLVPGAEPLTWQETAKS